MPLRTTPCDWALDDNGDVIIPLRYTTDLEAAAQDCRLKVLAVRGEWFANLDDGVRWFENQIVPERLALLGGRFSRTRVEDEIRTALLSAFAVVEVVKLSVTFDRATRRLRIAFTVRTEWGDTVTDTLENELPLAA